MRLGYRRCLGLGTWCHLHLNIFLSSRGSHLA
jgi:hypothetical protein